MEKREIGEWETCENVVSLEIDVLKVNCSSHSKCRNAPASEER